MFIDMLSNIMQYLHLYYTASYYLFYSSSIIFIIYQCLGNQPLINTLVIILPIINIFQVAAAFPLRITIQGQKPNLKQNKIDVKNNTVDDIILPDYAKMVISYYLKKIY